MAALGRGNLDHAEEVNRIVEGLPERDRDLLLEALPQILGQSGNERRSGDGPPGDGPARPGADGAGGAAGAGRTAASAAADGGAAPPVSAGAESDAPLAYGPPDAGSEEMRRIYRIRVDDACAASAPLDEAIRAGDELLVDPRVAPAPGDLLLLRVPGADAERARIRRLEALPHDRFALTGHVRDVRDVLDESVPLDETALAALLERTCAGTIVEIRRPLRGRRRAAPGAVTGTPGTAPGATKPGRAGDAPGR
jgi:hypothetical protein